jgi:hypothetical protein
MFPLLLVESLQVQQALPQVPVLHVALNAVATWISRRGKLRQSWNNNRRKLPDKNIFVYASWVNMQAHGHSNHW